MKKTVIKGNREVGFSSRSGINTLCNSNQWLFADQQLDSASV